MSQSIAVRKGQWLEEHQIAYKRQQTTDEWVNQIFHSEINNIVDSIYKKNDK